MKSIKRLDSGNVEIDGVEYVKKVDYRQAYDAYCDNCGCEYNNCKDITYRRTVANGEIGDCPNCNEEMFITESNIEDEQPKSELDLLKEKCASGDYVCYCKNDNLEHEELRGWKINPVPSFSKKWEWVLIHKDNLKALECWEKSHGR